MKIIEIALLENGWSKGRDGLLTFPIRHGMNLWAGSDNQTIFIECENGPASYELPNIKTMEDIKIVLRLLGQWEIIDTAPIDAAIRARFAEGEA